MPPPTPVSARSAWPSGNAAPGEKIPPADGVVTLRSSHGPEQTMKRLEAAVKAKGLYVFARVDHAASSTASEFPLRPTDLLIFGAAKVGTPLMQSAQTVGLDLPWKALVWQDDLGDTWLSYNDPVWLAKRHTLGSKAETTIKAMAGALNAIAAAATAS